MKSRDELQKQIEETKKLIKSLRKQNVKLKDEVQSELRKLGKISKDEVILKEGDLYIVLNVLTKDRRIVNMDSTLVEVLNRNNIVRKKILKG